jgi:non-canonical purine NTP pyrophosphatase (RdgB/HAM1 family)
MISLAYISSNSRKFNEIQAALPSLQVRWISIKVPEILSIDPREVLIAKAKITFRNTDAPFIMDHSALYFSHYDYKLPGCLIEPMIHVLGLNGICRLVTTDRHARSQTLMLTCDGRRFDILDAITEGVIVDEPRGENGFGWDAIFVPNGSNKTYAEMQAEEKRSFSSRTKVCTQLQTMIRNA